MRRVAVFICSALGVVFVAGVAAAASGASAAASVHHATNARPLLSKGSARRQRQEVSHTNRETERLLQEDQIPFVGGANRPRQASQNRRHAQEEWWGNNDDVNYIEGEYNENPEEQPEQPEQQPEQYPPNSYNDPKDCWEFKGGKTCTPSARPSVAPSAVPTTSPAPTTSQQPSVSPSISAAPSPSPTAQPSLYPSPAPSLYPSPSPSQFPTLRPTQSPQPSAAPSVQPTLFPTTAFPTTSPQPTWTKRPTLSPTVDPLGYISRISTDTTGETGLISSCRLAIPEVVAPANVIDQAVIFEYDLQLVPGTNAKLAVDYIASQLHRTLSEQYLTCRYYEDLDQAPVVVLVEQAEVVNDNSTTDNTDGTTTNSSDSTSSSKFHIQALSSLPVDYVENEASDCSLFTTEVLDNVECYRVDAAYLAKFFYLQNTGPNNNNRRLQKRRRTRGKSLQPRHQRHERHLQAEVNADLTDPLVLESFTSTLERLFANDTLTSGMSGIASATFRGITNTGSGNGGNGNGEEGGDSTDDGGAGAADDNAATDDAAEAGGDDDVQVFDDDNAPVAAQTDRSTSDKRRPGIIAGSVLGAAAFFGILAAVILFAVTRRGRHRQGGGIGSGGSGGGAWRRKEKAVDTTHASSKSGGVDNSFFDDLAADPSYERDDRAMLSGDQSYIASDDGSYFSTTGSQYEQRKQGRSKKRRGGGGGGRDNDDFKVAVIIEDEQSYGTGFDMLDPNEFQKVQSVQPQAPSFLKTDEILDSLRQAEMRSQMKGLGLPRNVTSSYDGDDGGGGVDIITSRGQRDYGMPDTVQL